jgi:hypothetical protein
MLGKLWPWVRRGIAPVRFLGWLVMLFLWFFSGFFNVCVCVCVVPGIDCRAFHLLGKLSATELHPQLTKWFLGLDGDQHFVHCGHLWARACWHCEFPVCRLYHRITKCEVSAFCSEKLKKRVVVYGIIWFILCSIVFIHLQISWLYFEIVIIVLVKDCFKIMFIV